MTNRILPIILIVLSIGLFWLYTMPTYNTKVQAANEQIQNYNAALQAAADFKQKEDQLIAERNAIAPSSLSRLQAFLPDGVDNVQLILDINQLASRYGLALSNFTISGQDALPGKPANAAAGSGTTLQTAAGTGAGLTNSITLSVIATGPYESFRSFLLAAEQSLRPLDVTQLSVAPGNNGNYNYNITFQIYWLK